MHGSFMRPRYATTSILSSQDEKAFEKVLNFFKVTDARSFAATVSLTGDGQGGIKYPSIVPFSYSFDESSKKYSVTTIGQGFIPLGRSLTHLTCSTHTTRTRVSQSILQTSLAALLPLPRAPEEVLRSYP